MSSAADAPRAREVHPPLFLQGLLDAAPNGMLVAGLEGGIRHANRHARQLFGLQATAGLAVRDLFAQEQGDAVAARVLEASGERPATRDMTDALELVGRRADGTRFAAEVHVTPFDAGAERLLMVTVTDVGTRRRLEEDLARSNRDLEQFAYAASHDLQEPLRMVRSYCELLERRCGAQLDARGREYVQRAVDGALRMEQLIDGLLAYSRAGRVVPAKTPVDAGAVADAVIADLRRQAEAAGGSVLRGDLPRSLPMDETALRQVLQNLVGNALKFHAHAAPVVRVSSDDLGDAWRISVADNGIGLDPADADRVFRMFQRLHTREEFAGNGIGLALARRLVEAHGGSLWYEANPGGGTRFHFTVPKSLHAGDFHV